MNHSLLEIARSGVLAPSADNTHVFRIELGVSSLRLWPTPEFARGSPRHRRVLGLISLGAVVENMRLRAGELGLGVTTNWSLSCSDGPIVQLDLRSSDPVPIEDLAAAIPDRHTNRRMYHGSSLSDEDHRHLGLAVGQVADVSLLWLRGDARRRALSLIWRAESERFLRQPLHEELFSSIRFDLSWHEGASVGLPPGALEVETPMRPMFKLLRHWALMRPLTWIGAHRLLGLRAGWLPCWQAPALGLLATSLPVDAGAIAVGTALQRLWLRSTLLGLALQPMAAAAILPLQASARDGASERLRATLSAGWAALVPGALPLLLFRIGRAAPPSVLSGRPALSELCFPESWRPGGGDEVRPRLPDGFLGAQGAQDWTSIQQRRR